MLIKLICSVNLLSTIFCQELKLLYISILSPFPFLFISLKAAALGSFKHCTSTVLNSNHLQLSCRFVMMAQWHWRLMIYSLSFS